MKKLSLLLLLTLIPLNAWATGKYWIDYKHSHVGFKMKHMGLFPLSGKFNNFNGEFFYDRERREVTGGKVTVRAASLDTSNHERDVRSRKPDFFDSHNYPEITYEVLKGGILENNEVSVLGKLTLKGVSREVTMRFQYLGEGVDLCNYRRVSFKGEGRIDRRDFNMNNDEKLANGRSRYSDKVQIVVQLSGVLIDQKQASYKCGTYEASRTRL